MHTSAARTLVVLLLMTGARARGATPPADAPLAAIVLRQVDEPSDGERLYRNYLLNRYGSYTARDPDGPHRSAAIGLGIAGAICFGLAAMFGALAYDAGSKTLLSLSHTGLTMGSGFTAGAGAFVLYLVLRDNSFPPWEDEGRRP